MTVIVIWRVTVPGTLLASPPSYRRQVFQLEEDSLLRTLMDLLMLLAEAPAATTMAVVTALIKTLTDLLAVLVVVTALLKTLKELIQDFLPEEAFILNALTVTRRIALTADTSPSSGESGRRRPRWRISSTLRSRASRPRSR